MPAERKAATFAELGEVIRRHREEHGPVWDDDEDPVGDLMAERERSLELYLEHQRSLDRDHGNA